MSPRRLLITPLFIILAALMVLVIIQMGERARGVAPAVASTKLVDPLLKGEQSRIDSLENSITRCTAMEPCVGVEGAVRLRAAATSIDRWPAEPRLAAVRVAMQEELTLRADLLELTALVDADGVRSERDFVLLSETIHARYDAALALLRARITAKLDHKSVLLAGLRGANAARSAELDAVRTRR